MEAVKNGKSGESPRPLNCCADFHANVRPNQDEFAAVNMARMAK
jgi:hypothetical protein